MLIFTLSTGRTGTVFVSKTLSGLPNIISSHERNNNILRILKNLQTYNNNAFFKKIGIVLMSRLLKEDKNNFYFEINNIIPGCMEDIIKKFPQARYIHMVRDPRTYVKSAMNWTFNNPFRRLFSLYLPFWQAKPKKFILGRDQVSKLFEIFVLEWSRVNSEYSKIGEKNKFYYLMKFEDLKKDPEKFIERILKISNFPYAQEDLKKAIEEAPRNESVVNCFGSWNNWDDKYVKFLFENCYELMRKYGYGKEQLWQKKVSESSEVYKDFLR